MSDYIDDVVTRRMGQERVAEYRGCNPAEVEVDYPEAPHGTAVPDAGVEA